ncbi:MAG: hypothetical protein D6732_22265 [Methanobacteriota archaeon]|nr:MAG: hypothetical protein D6732_22265 [Euryarchaeota archaeon]
MTTQSRREDILRLINKFFQDFDLLFNSIDKLNDPDKIIEMIQEAKDDKIAVQLVFRLAYLDEKKIAKLLRESKDEIIKQFGIFILKDEETLGEIARNEKSIWTALSAVAKITDQSILFELASNPTLFSSVRWEALRRINDEELLIKLAEIDVDEHWVKAVISKIESEENLLILRLTLKDKFQPYISNRLQSLSAI